MKLVQEIREKLEDEGYLSKTLDDEVGRDWRKDRNEYVDAIIAAKLEPIREALKLCEWSACEQRGWDAWQNVCPDCRNTKADGHADGCCDVAKALAMLEE